MEVIRSFIAIDLSIATQDRLTQILDRLRREFDQKIVRWVRVENIHLTIKFLGDVPVSDMQVIQKIFAAALEKKPKFAMQIGHFGAFPSYRNPRVIWVGVDAPSVLMDIKLDLESRLAELGYPQEKRAYTPHLTLGRVSKNARSNEIKNLGKVIQSFQIGVIGIEQVESVHLYKSVLKPSGAVYSRIATCQLMESLR